MTAAAAPAAAPTSSPRLVIVDWSTSGATAGSVAPGYHRTLVSSARTSPGLLGAPRFALLDGPSPLQRLPRLSAALGGGVEIWIKREDLLPVAFGGNKLRNLEYLVGAAIEDGAEAIVTSGRRWSNHCRLTAAAGARAGLDVHVVLTGPPNAAARGPRLDKLLGATVHWAATADRSERAELVRRVLERLNADHKKPYEIPTGGSSVTGTLGQVEAAFELDDQANALGVTFDAIVLPTATGGTQAGLLAGLRSRGVASSVIGFTVAHPAVELRPTIEALLAELGQRLGTTVPKDEIELDNGELGEGYGEPSEAARIAARQLARTEGLFVDPIYTAKALAGLGTRVRRGHLTGKRVVFWHAGGLPSLFEPGLEEEP
jgi:1-aminocyclopropane-1-carboxylate deaminase/D-cysteine desulfhydrase-like pyridoxal-dependent ACC family enzyme